MKQDSIDEAFPLDLRVIGSHTSARHQGHNLLTWKLAGSGKVRAAGWRGAGWERLGAKFLRRARRYRNLNPEAAWNLFLGQLYARRGRDGAPLVHFIWGDEYVMAVSHPERCIFTIHQPYEKWSPEFWAALPRCGGILAMARRERDLLRERLPGLPVEFIPLGIDTEFWRPGPASLNGSPKQICAIGRYMRNYEMLLRVSRELFRRRQDVIVRWLVNPDFAVPAEVAARLPEDRFLLVRDLSESKLREFYRESWLFFTPYDNVTASNAVVEAMACGIPIVSTQVGGMESYAPPGAALLVKNDDDQAALDALLGCLDSPEQRTSLGAKARAHAAAHFCWPAVVERHLKFYRTLARESKEHGGRCEPARQRLARL